MTSRNYSIVEFFKDKSGNRCSYCNSSATSYSHGMWAYDLDVMDYQRLIDRGWRRSGHYCYKPTMDITCCPMYTIQCKVEDFRMSKSHKKVLKRMSNFLKNGRKESDVVDQETFDTADGCMRGQIHDNIQPILYDKAKKIDKQVLSSVLPEESPSSSNECKRKKVESLTLEDKKKQECEDNMEVSPGDTDKIDKGDVQSAEHVPRKKAKLIRLENKYNKLLGKGLTEEKAKELMLQGRRKPTERKELETLIDELSIEDVKHKLELKLVRTKPPSAEFKATKELSFQLYKKYQMIVHNDEPDECSMAQYLRFLVNSPLEQSFSESGPPHGFGSFHQQYWLDGTLIAVGVIDILPKCVSSVYFYYDPDLRFLTLGTYGSLREIAFTRLLCKSCPTIKYYYMGYYIHSCSKMKYKSQYSPSYLLCPETYTWHPIEKCLPKFSINKYARLEENKNVVDENGDIDLYEVMILQKNKVMPYSIYKSFNPSERDDDIKLFAKLIGLSCVPNILLVKG